MVPSPASEDRQGFLNACLLEADPVLEQRARRIKRRAILVSIVLQILIVAALLLIPLLGKSENIARRVLVYPSVPYSAGHPHTVAQQRLPRQAPIDHRFYQPNQIPTVIVTRDPNRSENADSAIDNSDIARYGGDGNGPGVPFAGFTSAPQPPPEPARPHRIERRQTSEPVQNALLIHRVEPIYPALARQLHREGRVELHAIIAVDGSIQSLEVLSGDPLFMRSALDAVREWRYRPTILDGQPIEVDTHITVIYTLSH